MSRINQYVVATATFSVALGIGFVMQNGDALAARFADTPTTATPATALSTEAAPVLVRPAPREGTAAWLVRQRIDTGVTAAILAAAGSRDATDRPAMISVVPVPAEADIVLAAAATPAEEAAPALDLPDTSLPVVSASLASAPDLVLPAMPSEPLVEAALGSDAVPDTPGPDTMEGLMPGPACQVALAAEILPAALVDLTLQAPCSPSARATIHHQGMIFTVITDDAGEARMTVPALAEGAVFMADLGEGGGAVAVVTVPDLAGYDRAVLQWQGEVGPEIHALEFGASYGEGGHVWHGAPRAADVAIVGTGGFLMRLGDGAGLNPHMAEVYTFPSGATRQSGDVAFTVEAPVTAATCGRDLAAQTIQVSPGAEPFSFDLVLAIPDCDFVGEILVLKDMILDLTVAAR